MIHSGQLSSPSPVSWSCYVIRGDLVILRGKRVLPQALPRAISLVLVIVPMALPSIDSLIL